MLNALSDFLDKGALARLCRRIQQHLEECPECRYYVDTLKKTVVIYRSLGDEDIPWDVSQRLFKKIHLTEFKKTVNTSNR